MDPESALEDFRDQIGVTFPVLYDANGSVLQQYAQQSAFGSTIFPQDWIVGVDGKVAYVNNAYDPDMMAAVLDAQLAQ